MDSLSFQQDLLNVLKGNHNDYNKICNNSYIISIDNDNDMVIRYVSSYQLRVFVSSTFTDTHLERNIILDEIVPILKGIAQPYGIEIVFVDMRYGVRNENTADHMTWIACRDELSSCMKVSNGLFFLSLQGDKYGYQPIPKFIPQDVYDIRYASLSVDDQSLLSQWYQLDTNNIPIGVYVLKNLIDKDDPSFWSAQPIIQELLKDITFDTSDDRYSDIIVGRSVTEYEARSALANDEDRKRCLWISREFENGVPDVRDFNDTASSPSDKLKLDNLKIMMNDSLASLSNIIKNRVSYDRYIANDDVCKQYLSDFKECLVSYFTTELNSIITKKQRWLHDSFGVGVKGKDVDEMLHHCKVANEKCHDFVGREELLDRAIDMILADSDTISNTFRRFMRETIYPDGNNNDNDNDNDNAPE